MSEYLKNKILNKKFIIIIKEIKIDKGTKNNKLLYLLKKINLINFI